MRSFSALLLLPLALAACGRSDRPASDAADTAANTAAAAPGAPPPARVVAAADSGALAGCAPPSGADLLCFRAARVHDFAGDGRPFTITVDARGPRPDSLRVVLRIARGDTVLYRDDWTTTLYGVYDERPVSADSARRRAEHHLARVLADSAFRPARAFLGGASNAMLRESIAFDVSVDAERKRRGLAPGDTMPTQAAQSPTPVADSAHVRALAAELRDAPAFRYYAGGEATYAVAWSPTERRFVTVLSCC